MSLEDVTLILVGVANSMRKKKYVSSLLRCYILETWYFDELRGLFIILKTKIIVCQWTMLWQLKCIWCGIFFTGTSLPFEIRLTIVEQNGSNVNATAQASVSSKRECWSKEGKKSGYPNHLIFPIRRVWPLRSNIIDRKEGEISRDCIKKKITQRSHQRRWKFNWECQQRAKEMRERRRREREGSRERMANERESGFGLFIYSSLIFVENKPIEKNTIKK